MNSLVGDAVQLGVSSLVECIFLYAYGKRNGGFCGRCASRSISLIGVIPTDSSSHRGEVSDISESLTIPSEGISGQYHAMEVDSEFRDFLSPIVLLILSKGKPLQVDSWNKWIRVFIYLFCSSEVSAEYRM